MNSVLQQQADYVRNSNISVRICRRAAWVSIADDTGAEVFLQGDEARDFYDDVQHYSAENGVTFEDAKLIAAYPYADLVAESSRNIFD